MKKTKTWAEVKAWMAEAGSSEEAAAATKLDISDDAEVAFYEHLGMESDDDVPVPVTGVVLLFLEDGYDVYKDSTGLMRYRNSRGDIDVDTEQWHGEFNEGAVLVDPDLYMGA